MAELEDPIEEFLNSDDDPRTGAERFLQRMLDERKSWTRRKKAKIFISRRARAIWSFPGRKIRSIRWFIQRGKRGWSDYDSWSMDHYIARVNKEMLAHMREISHGYPNELCSVIPPFRSLDMGGIIEHNPDEGMERWMVILQDMEDGWAAAARYLDSYDEADRGKFEAMMPTYVHWFFGLWD